MRKTWNIVLAMWRPVLLGFAALIAIVGLMGWQLTSLTPGLSQPEIDTYNATRSAGQIIDNSVNAPYKTAVLIATKMADNTFGLRITGAALGAIAIVLFYLLARKLLSDTAALLATLLFASSNLLLVVSRSATANVMFLSLLAIIGVGYLIRFDKRQALAWILASIVIGASLYVPGLIIFILIAAIWQFRHCRRSFESLTPTIIIAASVLLSLIVAPLVISLIRSPELWREYLGLPSVFATPLEMIKDTLRAASSLFVYSPSNSVYWLGHQPVLDVLASVLFIFGSIRVLQRYKLDRAWLLFGILALTLVWIGITGNLLYLVMILPFIYLIIGFGIQELLGQWMRVFPRNPIARSVGLCLMVVAVALAANFQLRRYFIAWPNNSETKQAFSIPHPRETE